MCLSSLDISLHYTITFPIPQPHCLDVDFLTAVLAQMLRRPHFQV